MSKYVIGIDFGTLSARALLVNLSDGKVSAESVFCYPHEVMDKTLPDSSTLQENYALQHPCDYLDALRETIGDIKNKSGVDACDIIGVGLDFTSCTMLPTDEEGNPLCIRDEFKSEPFSYVKLWKHHGAEKEAGIITEAAVKCGEKWLSAYGGKVSSEWMLPKIFETYNKGYNVYSAADKFVEAADWIVWKLTGELKRSSCMAGYKGMWNKKEGYPSDAFLNELGMEFASTVKHKMAGEILPCGTKVGVISEEGEELTGLKKGTVVAVPIIDAHAALPAAGVVSEDKLMLIIGTSTCHIIMSKEDTDVPGICGRVTDGVVAGYTAYEAGQSCVGDSFDWFVKNCVPENYYREAEAENKNIFVLLEEKAEKLKVGESGLLALDWWNGNRTPYADYSLKGAILGFTLHTKAEEIYRALIEATAYGTKRIVDLYNENGVNVKEIYATGGISQKNKLLLKIYADVLGCEIKVPVIAQSGAMGSAVFASVAGGYFKDTKSAAKSLISSEMNVYKPNMENHKKYQDIYKEYIKLSKYFAEGENDVLKKGWNF